MAHLYVKSRNKFEMSERLRQVPTLRKYTETQ